MNRIYHIAHRSALSLSREYCPESFARQGFIHFSQRHQIVNVANAFYRGQQNLALLVVEPSRLKAELKYEAPAHPSAADSASPAGDLFPHLYGPLNLDAIVEVVDFPPNADGLFTLPDSLP